MSRARSWLIVDIAATAFSCFAHYVHPAFSQLTVFYGVLRSSKEVARVRQTIPHSGVPPYGTIHLASVATRPHSFQRRLSLVLSLTHRISPTNRCHGVPSRCSLLVKDLLVPCHSATRPPPSVTGKQRRVPSRTYLQSLSGTLCLVLTLCTQLCSMPRLRFVLILALVQSQPTFPFCIRLSLPI